jgi:hypothetical protein
VEWAAPMKVSVATLHGSGTGGPMGRVMDAVATGMGGMGRAGRSEKHGESIEDFLE